MACFTYALGYPLLDIRNNGNRLFRVGSDATFVKPIAQMGNGGPSWQIGTGSPEGVYTAPVGSFFSRTDGGAVTSFYVKESGTGNTGWIAK